MNKQTIKTILKFIFLAGFILTCIHHIIFVNIRAVYNYKVLTRNNFLYENIRKTLKYSNIGVESKKVLPRHAKVEILPSDWTLATVAIRYQLYPITMAENGTHIIDTKSRLKNIPVAWTAHKINKKTTLYAKEGHSFLNVPRVTKPISYFPSVIFSLLFAAFNIACGGMILNIFGMRWKNIEKLWYLSSSYLAGYLILTISVWLHLLMGGQLLKTQILFLWGVIFAFLIFLNSKRRKYRLYKKLKYPKETYSIKNRRYMRLLAILAVFVVLGIFFRGSAVPVCDWDGMSNWIMKSKVFFHERSLLLNYTHHNYYPLLWPINIAVQFMFLDQMHDQMAQWTLSILYLSFIIQVLHGLKILNVNRMTRYLVIAFYAAVLFHNPRKSFWTINLSWANAENIFLAYVSCVLVFLSSYLENPEEERNIALGAMMLLALGLTKIEGAVAVPLIAIPFIIFSKKKELTPQIRWIMYSMPALCLFCVLWMMWVHSQGFMGSMIHFQENFSMDKILFMFQLNFKYLMYTNTSLIAFCAILYYILCSPRTRWRDSEKFLFSVSVLFLLFALFAHTGLTRHAMSKGIQDSFPRLLIHATPSFLLWWVSRMYRYKEESGKKGRVFKGC